jgi:roadblock/LC7 domain-containing protein
MENSVVVVQRVRSDRVAAAFSPDGRLFAVSSAGRVMIMEAVNGRPMQSIERRFGEGDVRCLTFSPDSRLLGIGTNGPEPIVRISDTITANEYVTGTGHLGDVNAVAFSPDGKALASAGSDTSVLLWKVRASAGNISAKVATADDAWITSIPGRRCRVRVHGYLLTHPGRAVEVLGNGFKNVDKEQAQIRKWIKELDHDEFRIREAARRNLVKVGLRGAPALTDPKRTPLGAEGEQRVRLILETLESQGQRVPESGMFGDLLRMVRGVRVLELIGNDAAKLC